MLTFYIDGRMVRVVCRAVRLAAGHSVEGAAAAGAQAHVAALRGGGGAQQRAVDALRPA